jgi:regulatory protein
VNELRQKAIRLLARREHTRAELDKKLSAYGTPEEISIVLDQLQQSGLLSDARFAESYLRSKASRLGVARLRYALRNKGVSSEAVEASLAGSDLPSELERARALWQRKFGELPVDSSEWARQARFLQARGFTSDVIRRLLKDSGV